VGAEGANTEDEEMGEGQDAGSAAELLLRLCVQHMHRIRVA
jgi:hypothetical protein